LIRGLSKEKAEEDGGEGAERERKEKGGKGRATRSQYFGVEQALIEVAVLLRIRARTLAVMKTYTQFIESM